MMYLLVVRELFRRALFLVSARKDLDTGSAEERFDELWYGGMGPREKAMMVLCPAVGKEYTSRLLKYRFVGRFV